MGTRQELVELLNFLMVTDVRPTIDRVLPLSDARDGFAAMLSGNIFVKVVFTV